MPRRAIIAGTGQLGNPQLDAPLRANRRGESRPGVFLFPVVAKGFATRGQQAARSLVRICDFGVRSKPQGLRPHPETNTEKLSRSLFNRGRWVNNLVGFAARKEPGSGNTSGFATSTTARRSRTPWHQPQGLLASRQDVRRPRGDDPAVRPRMLGGVGAGRGNPPGYPIWAAINLATS